MGRRASRVTAARALPKLVPTLPPLTGESSGGRLPRLPFPAKGQGAVAAVGSGVIAASPREVPVPIASVTKMMTAYLVLRAHPLSGNEPGPRLTLTAADHRAWVRAAEHDDSNVEVKKGEILTERQMLEALLIPSADNMAGTLARWVGGSEPHFVSMMNAEASALGMSDTHYADASGLSSHSVSTAADQALLASVVMRNAVFRSIVRLPEARFPVEGHIWNYNPVLGVDGIVGVKSGFTPAAAGCLVTAARERVGRSGRTVLLVAAVTGQKYGLGEAGQADLALTRAAAGELRVISPLGSRVDLARVSLPWSHERVEAILSGPLRLAGWRGLDISAQVVSAPTPARDARAGWPAGTTVGRLVLSSRFGTFAALPLKLDLAVYAPSRGRLHPAGPVRFPVAP